MRTVAACALALAASCGTPPRPVDAGEPDRAPCLHFEEPAFSSEELEAILALSPLPEPPRDPTNAHEESEAAARLGRALFFDERLSADGSVSCATCHDPAAGFTDGRALSVGLAEVTRNAMTIWNAAHSRWFFWDGRADSLWAQALVPLEDPREHGTSRLAVAHLFHRDPAYRRAYEREFGPLPDLADANRFPPEGRPVPGEPDHPHARAWSAMAEEDRAAVDRVFANAGKAIAAYERRLVAGSSPFDRFVQGLRRGDPELQVALSAEARRGLALFVGEARCHVCHAGPYFSDLEFHDNRVPPLRGGRRIDPGRYEGVRLVRESPFHGAGPHSDDPEAGRVKVGYLVRSGQQWSEFKTPTLRNVELTAPYMHQGQLATLEDVVRYYSTLEDAAPEHHEAETILVPLGLGEAEQADLVAFLRSLTDTEVDPALLRPPESPELPAAEGP